MKRHLRYVLFLLGLLGLPWGLQATHIVGGEMNYRCLGNQQFEVVLTVFRDCYNGVPFFDNPASVGVFDAGGNLVENLLIPFVKDDTLKPILTGDCFILPPNACVHTTTYRRVVTLPVSPGGYTLAYQRCCRNKTILNIEKPDSTGATFSIFLSEEALMECNSSPVFKEWPPIYICVNEPIEFDHSALDQEGDSIIYRLCTPLDGGTLGNPQPVPPAKPPYKEIIWRDPPYNLDNVMGGVPLSIDPQTGWLTGLPNTIGQFVVGICADEYRDGALISSTRRDFQYNVGICGMTVAAFTAPDFQCGLTVKFFNGSANADQYRWYFNLDQDLTATSTEAEPVYTYPDSGTYRIMLIAQPDDMCADTIIKEIRVELLSIDADFDFAFPFCDDSLTVIVTDKSTDSLSTIVQWEWRLTSGSRVLTANEQFPQFRIDTAGVWVLNLIVTAENGCKDTARIVFPIRLATIPWPDTTLRICLGDTILLNPKPIPGVTHIWTPNVYLSSGSIANPLAWPDTTITYTLNTVSMNGVCKDSRKLTVEVSPPLVLQPPPDTVVCQRGFTVSGTTDRPAEWRWSLDPLGSTILATGNPAFLEIPGSAWVYVFVQDSTGCDARDSFWVTYQGLDLLLPDTLLLCPGEDFFLDIVLSQPGDSLTSLQWSPAEYFPDGTATNPALVRIPSSGLYTLFVEAENKYGCLAGDSLFVAVLDTLAGPADLTWRRCSGFAVDFQLKTPGNFQYSWHFGDPSQPTAMGFGAATTHSYPGPGLYLVTLQVISSAGCVDSFVYLLDLEDADILVDWDWSYLSCSDTALIQIRDISENGQSNFISREWYINGQFAGQEEEWTWLVTQSNTWDILLILESDDGCRDTLLKSVQVPVIEAVFPDTVYLCPGQSIRLNEGGNPDYTYLWSPGFLIDDSTAVSPLLTATVSQPIQVRVQRTDPDTCQKEYVIQLLVVEPPLVAVPSDTVTCLGAVLLQVALPPGISLDWYADPANTQLLAEGPVLFQQVPQPRTFYLVLTDAFGCRWTDSVNVRSSRLQITLPGAMAACAGDTICLAPVISGDSLGLQLEWSGAGVFFPQPGTNSVCIVPGMDPFELQLYAENAEGCVAEAKSVIAAAVPLPVIDATADPQLLVPGQAAQLQVTTGPGWQYLWSPSASLSDPVSPNPLAQPEVPTTYQVTVTDSDGCTAIAEVSVRLITAICEEPYIFIPNTFTPNGDGNNDQLWVRGGFIDELYFIVYDRWGNEVFSTRDKERGWDGTYKGRELNSDVFGYYLEARCFDGAIFTKRGNVTLLRK